MRTKASLTINKKHKWCNDIDNSLPVDGMNCLSPHFCFGWVSPQNIKRIRLVVNVLLKASKTVRICVRNAVKLCQWSLSLFLGVPWSLFPSVYTLYTVWCCHLQKRECRKVCSCIVPHPNPIQIWTLYCIDRYTQCHHFWRWSYTHADNHLCHPYFLVVMVHHPACSITIESKTRSASWWISFPSCLWHVLDGVWPYLCDDFQEVSWQSKPFNIVRNVLLFMKLLELPSVAISCWSIYQDCGH